MIGGTQSGVGKTSITLGIVAALRQAGLRVQTFKVGPDYLDPTYLRAASGRPCFNLDGWMTDENYVRRLFQQVCVDADVAIIEGVMGLFDGASPVGLAGSTAEIASWLDAPVLLVADAHGASRSFAATVHGFSNFDTHIQIAAVIANRTGSNRHGEWIAESLAAAALPPLLGHIQRGSLPSLPSRHLGLVSANPAEFSDAVIDTLARAVSTALPLQSLLQLANTARPLKMESDVLFRKIASKPVRLGIARDEAFHFYYPDNLAALEAAGCELVEISPLHDGQLPEALDGLYIGGGYPEEFAEGLAANTTMRKSIRDFAEQGGLIYAECGGLMYLSEGIKTTDGQVFPMLGILSAGTRMKERRQSLGYVEVHLKQDCFWGRVGESLRGHEFHYSELTSQPTDWHTAYEMRYRRLKISTSEGFLSGRILASYAHLHFASSPAAIHQMLHHLQTL